MTTWSVLVLPFATARHPLTGATLFVIDRHRISDRHPWHPTFHHNRVDFIFVGIIVTILVGIAFAVTTVTTKIQDTVKYVP
jgi:hypothetical protein